MLVATAAVALVACGSAPAEQTFHGGELVPAAAAPDLVLADQHGQPFRLADHAGQIALVTFGYTHCPDFCPVTLSLYRHVKERLGTEAAQVRFVFVTVDPERDTPAVIGAHLDAFDPSFVGLTGPPAEVAGVLSAWGVQAKASLHDTVDHSTSVYVVDAGSRLRLTYPAGVHADEVAADVRNLLREGAAGA